MIFSSPIFLFSFLPVVFLGSRLLPDLRWKNLLLAAASVVCCCFGQIGYVALLLCGVMLNYGAGLLLQREGITRRKAAVAFAVAGNLAVLAGCRFLGHQAGSFMGLLAAGVFTMKGLSYVIDVYRDSTCGTADFVTVLLYVGLFPMQPAGPIVKYHEFADQLTDRTCSAEMTAAGIQQFLAGLGKKLLLGDTLALVAESVFRDHLAAGMDFRLAWLGCICNALHVYLLLSGYSDMAIGMGKMFGFRIPENFSYPYAARTLGGFWRRWNISLTAWLGDYLYRPLRGGKLRSIAAGLAVFLCIGMWHGTGVTFAVWGLAHGLLVTLERLGVIPVERMKNSPVGRVLCRVYTVLIVLLLSALLRAVTVREAWTLIAAMFGFAVSQSGTYAVHTLLSGAVLAALVLGAVISTGSARRLSNRMLETPMWVQDTYMIGKRLGSLAVLVLCMLCLAQGQPELSGFFRF